MELQIIMEYLKGLKENNNRDWYLLKHKSWYVEYPLADGQLADFRFMNQL